MEPAVAPEARRARSAAARSARARSRRAGARCGQRSAVGSGPKAFSFSRGFPRECRASWPFPVPAAAPGMAEPGGRAAGKLPCPPGDGGRRRPGRVKVGVSRPRRHKQDTRGVLGTIPRLNTRVIGNNSTATFQQTPGLKSFVRSGIWSLSRHGTTSVSCSNPLSHWSIDPHYRANLGLGHLALLCSEGQEMKPRNPLGVVLISAAPQGLFPRAAVNCCEQRAGQSCRGSEHPIPSKHRNGA